ncbi:MAG: DNA mismatch repair endonuclease MutL [Prevotellaceae bacterium]|nr:DNA mismatch repair endonuclease MutL [Prevotellaceae bacterium]
MNDVIQLLPDSVANQIAAGEVVQRPASVIKELVENSVDAGATRIDVLVVDAGKTSIQVIDNGKGMTETDARMAFERHATSKIRQASDLFALHTMGFRGEALPSIAAVAQVELKTRTQDDQLGTHLIISGSKVERQEAVSCPVGCNILVKNIFFNVPARRRFLKQNNTELNNIISAFEKIVLVNPQIAFTLHSNCNEVYNLPISGLKQRIVNVMGKRVEQTLLPINVDTTLVKIRGFIGKPESAKKKGASQYFFVNDRYMRHPYFHKAVTTAYERLIPAGDQIPYYIYMEVDPNDIDVNIHPTKTEIKFDNEQSVWQILLAGVKEALGTFCEMPELEFTQERQIEIPVYNPAKPMPSGRQQMKSSFNPFSVETHHQQVYQDWEQMYAPAMQSNETPEASLFETPDAFSADIAINADASPVHYQYKGQYIMTAVKSGLMIIDQHRAHVRILYEDFMKQKRRQETSIQKVLFPEIIEFSPSETLLFEKIEDEVSALGFDIINLGNGSFSVNGIPSGLKDVNPTTLLHDIVSAAKEGHTDIKEELNSSLCLTIARSASVSIGQVLSNEEMDMIVNRLFACENTNYTPDGKCIFYILPQTDIEKMLK